MIKISIFFMILTTLLLAQSNKSNAVSKFEVKNGKKVYFPVEKQPITYTIQNQIIESDVKVPVVKGFYVEYKK